LGGIQPGNLAFFSTVAATTTTINEAGTSRSTGEPILVKSTVLTLDSSWRDASDTQKAMLRSTNVYFQSEELELAEEPIEEPVRGGTDQLLELDGVYEDLESGRWVIVSGERDIAGTSGVRFSELAMLATVTQNVGTQIQVPANQTPATTQTELKILDGDQTRTFITLANKLEYRFKRDTVTIYGNVVKATHGETHPEVLGSGDGGQSLQSFTLKQPPLTYISASNPSGVDSTLKLYVNDVQWREADALAGLTPTDRSYITKTDDEGKTTVVFGNGRQGALLPTGIENIKAEYRSGIGKPGNVNAGQITLLTTRPLGVKELINPLQAFGGADKENRDQARKNAPLAVKALDRLVSVQDYEDFARIYAGIGKARAVELPDGRRQLVHVTIAGADDIPIDKNSDLYRNLRLSLLDSGDPFQAIQLEVRELMLMVIEARIRILPDYLWEPVVTQVRNALLDAFSFERRELGQDILLSEVQSVMQAVRGVAYVDVDVLGGIPEKKVDALHPGQRRLLTPGEIADLFSQPLKDGKDIVDEPRSRIPVNLAGREDGTLRPAQLAFLSPDVPATLNLNQIT
jgi:predicted phage baseplate assembly protein